MTRKAKATVLLIALFFAGCVSLNNHPSVSELFSEQWNVITKEFIKPIPNTLEQQDLCFQKMLGGGISHCLNDRHSRYMTKEEVDWEHADYEGNLTGVGLELTTIQGRITVVTPIKDSPAEYSGMFESGDVIVEVDAQDIANQHMSVVIGKIRGPEGAPVTIRVERDGKKMDPVTLTRKKMFVASVTDQDIDDDITYISIREFNQQTHLELFNAIANRIIWRLEDGSFLVYVDERRFIIDLRKNPGGLLYSVLFASGFFSDDPEQIMVTTRGRNEEEIFRVGDYFTEGMPIPPGMFQKVRLVILIDAGTASGAEILAEFLHQATGAPRVGVQSYGKGTVQTEFLLKHGDALHLTIKKYFVGNNETPIDGIGINPEYPVETVATPRNRLQKKTIDPENDPQLKKAIEILHAMPPAIPD